MCGIAGILYFDKEREVNNTVIKQMTDSIIHRGPDDEGIYIQKNIGLGFRRLSIIDLHTGHQPIANKDESIWIIFNGEIYNFLELKEDLQNKGYHFKTQTDTEVILHLYEEYNSNCLKYLRGMFSFAIWDYKKNQLFCARDRFGIKPFFYYIDNEKFIFGSEIKAIKQVKKLDLSISLEALNFYFSYGYIGDKHSIYKNIHKLPQAHFLILDMNNEAKLKIERYWEINFVPNSNKSEYQWKFEIEKCLSESVRMHMISDVTLGAFLSGGIDSSSVVALMAKYSNKPIKTFSIGFKEKKYNELEYAHALSKKYQTEHYEQIIEPESISILPKLVQAYDEPFGDSSAIPTYYVSKFAREYVKVILSGDGGDELFAGYDYYLKMMRFFRYNFKSESINKLLWGGIHNIIPEKLAGKGLTYYLSKNKSTIGAYFCLWQENERKKLFNNDISYRLEVDQPEKFKEALIKNSSANDFIDRMIELDTRSYLTDDILTKVDRVSMLNSLEVRVPILDHKFAELSFQIPSKFKLKNSTPKHIFKQTMSDLLPESILKHPKQGFTVPLTCWFKDDLKQYLFDRLLYGRPLLSDYLNLKYIAKVVDNHLNGQRNFSSKLWTLLFFEEWLQMNK